MRVLAAAVVLCCLVAHAAFASADTLLVGYDSDTVTSACWLTNSTSLGEYSWKAFRGRAKASGTIDYFKLRTFNNPAGCTHDSGCWAIYEDGGSAAAVGALKAYQCFTNYDWTAIGTGTHRWNAGTVVTDRAVTAGRYYSVVFLSWAVDSTNYRNAGCSNVIYSSRGRAGAECAGTLDGMIATLDSSWPPPPAGTQFDTAVQSYFAWGVWASSDVEAPSPPANLRLR